jgi:3-oxoacyl-[acyl-carrier protein] reductase
MMDLKLSGLTALVTGGSRGIGYAVAARLASEGCHLHLASRNAPDLDSAKARLLALRDIKIVTHPVDLGAPGAAERLAAECPDLDILVNNAGAIPHGALPDIDEARWRAAWDLKVFGTINLSRAVYTAMQARVRGVIVNVIGAAGEQPRYDYVAGSAGNAALMGFTRALGGNSVDRGIRVVGVNPGSTETDRQIVRWEARAKARLGDASRWRELVADAPFGRLATADEIATVVVFMASDCASYVSGTIITVDGGRSSRNRPA